MNMDNLLIVLVDSLRFDTFTEESGSLSSMNLLGTDPDCRIYNRCFAPAGWTLPSVAAVMTGMYPGYQGKPGGHLNPEYLLLQEYRRKFPPFDPVPWNKVMTAFVKERYKLIYSERGDHELFDLADDPREERNIFSEALFRREFEGPVQGYQQEIAPFREQGDESESELDEAMRRQLKGLGYL